MRLGSDSALEQRIFSSCHISVAGTSLLETNEVGQVDPRRVAVHTEFWRATCGTSVSVGLKAGLESLGPDRGVLSSLGVAGTTWLLSESSYDLESERMMWGNCPRRKQWSAVSGRDCGSGRGSGDLIRLG